MFFSFKWKYPIHILLYLGYFSQYFWDECFLLRASVIHLFSFLCYRSQPDTFGFVGRKVSVYLTLLLSCEHGHRQYAVLVVQSLSCVQLFVTPWTTACQASLSITNSQSLLKLMSIELVMPSSPSHPLSSASPPAFSLSQHQGLFKWVSSSHQVAKVLELQLQHQSFQWIFRDDFL